jgi:hypothetical protein
MIEPSTAERSEWPDATTSYVCALEHRMLYLECLLDEARNLIPSDYSDEKRLRARIDAALGVTCHA